MIDDLVETLIGAPTIVPLILVGIIIGSMLRKTTVTIRAKSTIIATIVGGVGNAAYAWAVYYLSGTDQSLTLTVFVTIAFGTGALIVLVVFAAAMLTLRLRGRTEVAA